MPFVLYQPPISAESFEQGAREVASDAIRVVIGDETHTADIELTILEGAPSLRLLDLAETAEMIVLGSRAERSLGLTVLANERVVMFLN